MKKKKSNRIDLLIERLSESFTQIKNFEKLHESKEGQKLWNLIVKSISEIETFQSLFLSYYIPASNKSIVDSWNEISKSKYKHLLDISKEDLKENLYETIRLGYVGLFHKYESYLKALVKAVNFLLNDLNKENNLLNIEEYCKKKYKINIHKSHDLFSITSRINYIANCIKHYDGFPIKKPVHKDFEYSNTDQKIKIDRDVFKSDIERLKTHCQLLMSQIMTIGFKQYLELDYETIKKSLKPELKESEETKEKLETIMKQMDSLLSEFEK